MKLKEAPVANDSADSTGSSYIKALFESYHERIYMAAYRITGSSQDAQDVLQSIFLALLKKSEIPDMGAKPISYLCRSAINASLDLLRSRQRNQTINIDGCEPVDTSSVLADTQIFQTEIRQKLRTSLASLHHRAAEIFSLRYFEDFSNADIAKMLGISSSSVAVELHRTRNRLQELLREFEGESQ